MTPKVKKIKTCYGCPYLHWGRCSLVPQKKGEWKHPEIPESLLKGRKPPPDWCPLRKKSITLEIDTEWKPGNG